MYKSRYTKRLERRPNRNKYRLMVNGCFGGGRGRCEGRSETLDAMRVAIARPSNMNSN